MFDITTEFNLLYDFYAQLLTEKQREVIRLYHCEDFSLSEIGEEFSISRQGVYDALKNAERALLEYEEKLELMQKFEYTSKLMRDADRHIGRIAGEIAGNKSLAGELYGLKRIIDELGR